MGAIKFPDCCTLISVPANQPSRVIYIIVFSFTAANSLCSVSQCMRQEKQWRKVWPVNTLPQSTLPACMVSRYTVVPWWTSRPCPYFLCPTEPEPHTPRTVTVVITMAPAQVRLTHMQTRVAFLEFSFQSFQSCFELEWAWAVNQSTGSTSVWKMLNWFCRLMNYVCICFVCAVGQGSQVPLLHDQDGAGDHSESMQGKDNVGCLVFTWVGYSWQPLNQPHAWRKRSRKVSSLLCNPCKVDLLHLFLLLWFDADIGCFAKNMMWLYSNTALYDAGFFSVILCYFFPHQCFSKLEPKHSTCADVQ